MLCLLLLLLWPLSLCLLPDSEEEDLLLVVGHKMGPRPPLLALLYAEKENEILINARSHLSIQHTLESRVHRHISALKNKILLGVKILNNAHLRADDFN